MMKQGFYWLIVMMIGMAVGLPTLHAQEDAPDIDEFVFAEEEPQPLNMEVVRDSIGYPEESVAAGEQGTVIARVLVDTTGRYLDHKIVKYAATPLVLAVEEHLPDLQFSPAIANGQKIKFWVNIPFNFKLVDQNEVNRELVQRRIDSLTEELRVDADNWITWHRRGVQYTQLQDYESALTDFNESLRLNPRKNKRRKKKNSYDYLFYSLFSRGLVKANLADTLGAVEDLTKALQAATDMAVPDSGVEATLANTYLERGYQQALLKRFAEAELDYREAIARMDSADRCDMWELMVDLGLSSDNDLLLAEAYDQLIGCAAEPSEMLYYSRGYYRRQAAQYEDAIADFRKVVGMTENPSIKMAALNYLALAQLDAGLPADAEATTEQVLQLNSLNPLAYYVKAQIAIKMNNEPKICENLRRALVYGVAGEEAEIAKQQMLNVCGVEFEE